MRYCPDCKKPYPEEAYDCPECGYSPDAEAAAEATARIAVPQQKVHADAPADEAAPVGGGPAPEQPVLQQDAGKTSKFFGKKPLWIALAIAAALIVIAVGGFFLYRSTRSDNPAANSGTASTATDSSIKAYQDNLNKSWNSLRDITVELVKKDREVVDQASLNSFTALLTISTDKVEQIRNEMGRIEAPQDYRLRQQNLVDAVGSYRDYLKSLLAVTAQDPAKINSASFQPVNTAGEDAQKKVVASEKQLPFLRALPDECFILHTTLNTFYTTIWKQPTAPRPAPGANSRPGQAGAGVIAADSGLTSATAGGFSEAYLAGDYGAMESYLSGSGWNFEFNYAQPPYSYEYGDPTGQADTVRIIYLFAGTGDQPYLEDWAFQVAYVNDNAMIINSTLMLRSEFTNN